MRTSGKKNHESVLRFCRSYYTLWSLFSPPLNSPSRTAWWFMTHTSFWFQTQLSNIKRILHMTKWLTTEGWKTRGKKETDWTTMYYQKRERGNWNVSHSRVTNTTDTTGSKTHLYYACIIVLNTLMYMLIKSTTDKHVFLMVAYEGLDSANAFSR